MSNYSKYGFKNHFDVVNTARFYFKDLDALNLERDKKDRNKFSYEDYGSRKVNVTMLKDGNAEFVLENGNKEIYSVDEFANNISLGDIDGLMELKKENKKMIDSYAIGGKLTKSQITGKEKGKLLDVLYKAKFDAEQAGNKADVTLIEKLISKSIKGADISDSVEFKSLFNQGGRYFGYQSGGETPETELDFHPAYSYAKGGDVGQGYKRQFYIRPHLNPNNPKETLYHIYDWRNDKVYGLGAMGFESESKAKKYINQELQDQTYFAKGGDLLPLQKKAEESYKRFMNGGYIISGAKDKVTDLELDEIIEDIKEGYGWATIDTIRQLIDYVTKDKKYNLDDKVYNKDGIVYQILGYGDEQTIIEYLRDGIYIFPTEIDEKYGNTSEDINILSIQQIKKDRSGPWATSGTSINKYYLSASEDLGEQDIYEWANDLWSTSPEAPISHSFELEKKPWDESWHGYLEDRDEWVLTVKETIYYN